MEIQLNGEAREVEDGCTVARLFDVLALRRQGTAIEVNEAVVPRSEHASTPLRQGDRVEVVTMMGGG